MQNSLNVPKAWILAARPKTLVASISPVLIGASLAGWARLDLLLLCLFFSLFIQIGANVANDYFDYIKGTDTAGRIGPIRAAQSGLIPLDQMKKGMFLIFATAVLISVPLLIRGGVLGIWIVASSILFAILYTAGPRPLGYLGLGEFFVFLFYGPVATLCTYYVLTLKIEPLIFFASLPPGLLCCSILIANNLRDERSDRIANKKTLIVRFGKTFGRWEYAASIGLSFLIPLSLSFLDPRCGYWFILLAALPAAYTPLKKAFSSEKPEELIPLLPLSARLLGLYTLLFIFLGFSSTLYIF